MWQKSHETGADSSGKGQVQTIMGWGWYPLKSPTISPTLLKHFSHALCPLTLKLKYKFQKTSETFVFLYLKSHFPILCIHPWATCAEVYKSDDVMWGSASIDINKIFCDCDHHWMSYVGPIYTFYAHIFLDLIAL